MSMPLATQLLLLLPLISSGQPQRTVGPPDESSRMSDQQELYSYLLMDYEKDVRPTLHHSIPTNVTFGFLLQMVVDVDEKNQVMTTRSWLNINWMDYRLRWNSSLYNDIKIMHVPHRRVWKPDILLTNNADPEYKDAVVSTDVFVTPDGNVSWLASGIFRSSCQIRVRYYPFDKQECNLTFASWSNNGEEINLKLLTEEGDLSSYVNNSEFILIFLRASRKFIPYPSSPEKPWPVVTITVFLERRPLFYVFNHILPCVLISSMAILGFYVPPDTGEKVTMCITTMLSMGVYLKTITEIIPPTSEAVPLIGVYYVVSLGVVCLATVVNVWTLNLYNKGQLSNAETVPPWIRKWILGYMAKLLFIAIHEPDSKALFQMDSAVPEEEEETSANKQSDRQQKRNSRRRFKRSKKSARVDYDYELRILGRREDRVVCNSVPLPDHSPQRHWAYRDSASSDATSPTENHQFLPHNRRPPSFYPTVHARPVSLCRPFPVVRKEQSEMLALVKLEFETRFQKILRKVYRTIEMNEMRQTIQEERAKIMWEWKQLAEVVDRVLLWLFILATSLTTFFILFEPALLRDHTPHFDSPTTF